MTIKADAVNKLLQFLDSEDWEFDYSDSTNKFTLRHVASGNTYHFHDDGTLETPAISTDDASIGTTPRRRLLTDLGGSTTVYVDASSGDDSNDGSSSNPLATIQEAVNRLPRILRQDYYIDVAAGDYSSEDVLIRGVHAANASTSGGFSSLTVSGDTATPSNVTVNSISAVNCTGINNPHIEGFEFTGIDPYDAEGSLSFYGCENGLVEGDNNYVNNKSGTPAIAAYNSLVKVQAGAQDIGSGLRSAGVQAKRAGYAIVVGDVTGTAADYLLVNIGGGSLIYDSSIVTGSGTSGTVLGREGRVVDRADNIVVDGTARPLATAYLSANQSISNSTVTTVALDTVEDQTNGEFDTTTNKYTAEYAGSYRLEGMIRYVSPPDGTRCLGRLNVNGGTIAEADTGSSSGVNESVVMSTVTDLAAGDTVSLAAFQDSGASLDIQGNQKATRMSVAMVGGTDD